MGLVPATTQGQFEDNSQAIWATYKQFKDNSQAIHKNSPQKQSNLIKKTEP